LRLAALIAAMAVIFAIGLLLLWVEVEAPVERLLGALQQADAPAPGISQSALSSSTSVPYGLAEGRFRGPLRQVARALNDALRTAAPLITAQTRPTPVSGNPNTLPRPNLPLAPPPLNSAVPLTVTAEHDQTAPLLPLGMLPSARLLPVVPAVVAVPTAMSTPSTSEETRVAVGSAATDDPQTVYYRSIRSSY